MRVIPVNIYVTTHPDVHNVHTNVHRPTLVKMAFVKIVNVVNVIHTSFLMRPRARLSWRLMRSFVSGALRRLNDAFGRQG
jgi:hypothetical protein